LNFSLSVSASILPLNMVSVVDARSLLTAKKKIKGQANVSDVRERLGLGGRGKHNTNRATNNDARNKIDRRRSAKQVQKKRSNQDP
jgi:hypothetical protein